MPSEDTRPVSVRVPKSLPDKVRALTGMTFSNAVVTMLTAFVAAKEAEAATPPTATEPTE